MNAITIGSPNVDCSASGHYLLEPMITLYQLDSWEQYAVKRRLKINKGSCQGNTFEMFSRNWWLACSGIDVLEQKALRSALKQWPPLSTLQDERDGPDMDRLWHVSLSNKHCHYNDVVMGTMASQITNLTIVYSTVYPGADKKDIKAPRHWPLRGEFPGRRWIPRTKGQ